MYGGDTQRHLSLLSLQLCLEPTSPPGPLPHTGHKRALSRTILPSLQGPLSPEAPFFPFSQVWRWANLAFPMLTCCFHLLIIPNISGGHTHCGASGVGALLSPKPAPPAPPSRLRRPALH